MAEDVIFTPTKDFESKEMRSVYVKGLSYKLKVGNEKLAAELAKWQKDGLVLVGDAAKAALAGHGAATVAGKGTVK